MLERANIRVILALLLLGVSGILRLPLEEALHQRLVTEKLIQAPLDFKSKRQLGQRFSLMTLGGLRNFVAAWQSLNSYTAFEEGNWLKLEQQYQLITTLAPRNEYYWETGAWHLAYNAAGRVSRDASLRPAERHRLQKIYVDKGREFYRQGIEANPESWDLKAKFAALWMDEARFPDYEKAFEAYRDAASYPDSLQYYERATAYCLARLPGREQECYDLLRQLWMEPINRVPTVRVLMMTLQNKLKIPASDRISEHELIGAGPRAYVILKNYYYGSAKLPQNGVLLRILQLEDELRIPQDQRILHNNSQDQRKTR